MFKRICALTALFAAAMTCTAYAGSVSVNGIMSAGEQGIMLTASETGSYSVTAAEFDAGGQLISVSRVQAELTVGEPTLTAISGLDGGEKIYIWNDLQQPVCGVYENSGDGIIHLLGDSIDARGVDNVIVQGTAVTICAAGSYTIEGTLDDGQIVVSEELSKSDSVSITLAGVDVTSLNSAPFNGAEAKIELTLAGGTKNTFTDTAKYSGYTTQKEPKGCVYARRDLDIGGTGTLCVNAKVKNGIVCGADLKFKKGANAEVTAVNNAIKGDNSVEFTSKTGTVTVTAAEGDAIKSDAIDSDTGLLEQDKGSVTIAGGTFELNAGGDGIQADRIVEITGGSLTINSAAEGIKANEVNVPASADDAALTDADGNPVYINGSIEIGGGEITIISGEDGIKASESVSMSGGAVVNISAGSGGYDGIQAGETVDTVSDDGLTTTSEIVVAGTVTITDETVNITASDDAVTTNGDFVMSGGSLSGTAGGDFIKAYNLVDISGGSITAEADGDGIQSGKALVEVVSGSSVTESDYTAGNISISGGSINIITNSGHTAAITGDTSCKGIKANTTLSISGGEITVDSADDAIHSNYIVEITGGSMILASGDDGVHADYLLTLGTEGGSDADYTIDITTSYEGLEGSVIKILSGTQYVYSTDDGINAAGDYSEDGTLAASSSSGTRAMGGAFGGNPGGGSGSSGPDWGADDSSANGMLYIKGGKTFVEAVGDGLDSNGSIDMSGGIVVVNGPTSSNNGVFDIGDTASTFNVSGGTLLGAGTSGMTVTVTVTGQGSVVSGGSSGGGSRPGSPGSTGSTGSTGSAGVPVKLVTDSGNIIFNVY